MYVGTNTFPGGGAREAQCLAAFFYEHRKTCAARNSRYVLIAIFFPQKKTTTPADHR